MKHLLIIFLLILTSCSVRNKICYCKTDLSRYHYLSYQLLAKEYIGMISKDSMFNADILIKSSAKKNDVIIMDSIYCFCLAVCSKESIVESRFYYKKSAYELAKKYGIESFTTRIVQEKISNNQELQDFCRDIVGSIKINNPGNNWRRNLNSDNFKVVGFKQIAPLKGKSVKTKLLISR